MVLGTGIVPGISNVMVRALADALGGADEIRAAILGGLLPGVILVPAMLVTLTQLQERGVKYLKSA